MGAKAMLLGKEGAKGPQQKILKHKPKTMKQKGMVAISAKGKD